MKLSAFLKSTFGKDLFKHLKQKEIAEQRIRVEKQVERISDEIKTIQAKIQKLMLESKGQPNTMKLLNIQKIKALRLESATKQQEAGGYIKQLQLLLLLEAMREHHKTEEKNELIEKVLNSDVEHLTDVLFGEEVQRAIKEGRMDDVKDRLKRVFAKEEMPTDAETMELLDTISELEKVEGEAAVRIAGEKAKKIAERPLKRREEEEE